jgi:hypothetical protein
MRNETCGMRQGVPCLMLNACLMLHVSCPVFANGCQAQRTKHLFDFTEMFHQRTPLPLSYFPKKNISYGKKNQRYISKISVIGG